MSVSARIAETTTLPSKGLIYEESVNPNIILGSMKTKHEMMRLSATTNSNKIMCDIIDDCIQSPVGISSYDMCLGDYQFLLYKLRIITFGTDYSMSGVCPHCGMDTTVTVNLDDFYVHEYDDELSDALTVHLPVTDCDVELTLQTPRILDKINNAVRDRRKRTKKADNPLLLYTITTSIAKVDGEEMNPFTLEEWVKDLPLKDSNIILNQINKVNSMIGVDLTTDDVCSNCGRYYEAPFRITGEFFRPSN